MDNRTLKFTKNLIIWYLENKRSLPWRHTSDPYKVWLSEIILQQTRVSQGLPYYESFVSRFPTVFDLANASEEEVLKLWQGLGYYSRARNLHATAKMVVNTYKGKFPNTYNELLKLKGVGDYTASAIASICFEEPAAVVDGNVFRVLSRVYGIETPINTTTGFKEYKALAQTLIHESDPGTFNQALMEFGAKFCVPSNPDCESCIFRDQCYAYAKGIVTELPLKLNKTKTRTRYFNYLVILDEEGRTFMVKREGKGIWRNLYEFPLVESNSTLTKAKLKLESEYKKWADKFDFESVYPFNDEIILHKLSHQNLKIRFWIAELNRTEKTFISTERLLEQPVPIVIANFISNFAPFQL